MGNPKHSPYLGWGIGVIVGLSVMRAARQRTGKGPESANGPKE